MFGRYALPSDDLGADATVTASAEDTEYPAENLVAPTNTGHLNLPSRPAKLTTTSGSWVLDCGSAISPTAIALIYHNLIAGLAVAIQGNASDSWGAPSFSQAITIPAWREDDWPVSPFALLAGSPPPSYRYWRLVITGTNDNPVQVGRLMLVNLRQMANDVRWGVVEEEEQGLIEHATEAGVETIYELFGPRRSFAGEFALTDTTSAELLTLFRSARSRILPWLLIPDDDVNDAWLVRFQENRWSRTRETINHNIFPFRVQELSRGLRFP